ncbi:MAG TPA: nucleoside phosphorylase [Terracidiphilus sp.]|jgi:adenosylhomocysteine nucleosidase|nr:nucleoside phosphorylase [Terracidiphilus sp.]
MTRTALIAAMPAELKAIVVGWKHTRRDGVDLWSHRDENLYVAACAGTGQAAATRAFAAVEADAPVDLVFSLGWAGALREGVPPGSAHNVAGVIDVRTGERFQCDAHAGSLWLATSPRVADETEKRRLAAAYPNVALIDMEAAAIARLAQMRGIPFYAIKGVSDALDAKLPDFNRFIAPDGRFQTGRFVLSSLLRPSYWPSLIRMGENSRKASQTIAESLQAFLQ